ncbi:hypothetical protein K502DRAFT_362414 [Neoconidiobolus thromboides FSU 785]|nr:hypothetical protein K502DRAFT_362414 [Neoconidiobolus thromboides FSU 785]
MGDSYPDQGDLLHLSSDDSGSIASYLLNRLDQQDTPYSSIGNSVLINLNPGKALQIYNDDIAELHAEQGYKNFDDSFEPLPPHIFGLATKAYLHLRRLGEDQSFVFCGATNSGKSENYKLVLSQLCRLAANPKKPSKIDEQLANLGTVMEAFGNAATIHNKNSTRFGKFQEIQFNARGRIIGIKTLTYFLDKSRVVQTPTGERSFHVFYQLLHGASAEEREALYLGPPSTQNFSYLINSGNNLITSHDDKANFGHLTESMKGVGLKSKARAKIFQTIASILHLGNLNFVKHSEGETCAVSNADVLDVVSDLLGVEPQDLETALTARSQMVGKELCTVFLDVGQAQGLRDLLSTLLYSLLFSWIIEAVNSRFCEEEPANFIALLDQFGFQSYQTNFFEQFCINFSNERIHQFTIERLISPHHGFKVALMQDGIQLPVTSVPKFISAGTLLAGEDGETGLVKAINQHSGKTEARRTDDKLLSSLRRSFGDFPEFISEPNNTSSFTIRHFAGSVDYTLDDFIEVNLDGIPPDFVTLFRNPDGTNASGNAFIGELFSSEAVQTQSHPQNQRTIVSAQQPTAPMRQPSRKHKKKPSEGNTEEGSSKVNTILKQINYTLNDLFATLDDTRIWTVINIAPFDSEPGHLMPSYNLSKVAHQVESFSLPLLMDHLGLDFGNHFTYEEFIERYELVARSMNLDPNRSPRQQVESFATISGWASGTEFVLGNSKIFINESKWKDLEDSLRVSLRDVKSGAISTPKPGFLGNDDNDSLYSGYDGGNVGRLGYNIESVYVDDVNNNVHRAVGESINQGYGHYGEKELPISKDISDGVNEKGQGHELSNLGEVKAKKPKKVEEIKLSPTRKRWVKLTWMLTWMIPTCCMARCGITRPDVQMAWREKVAICILIVWSWIVILFVNIGLGLILCPPNPGHEVAELQVTRPDKKSVVVYMYGNEYEVRDYFNGAHGVSTNRPQGYAFSDEIQPIIERLNQDIIDLFPKDVGLYCSNTKSNKALYLPFNKTEDDLRLDPPQRHQLGSYDDIKRVMGRLKPFIRGSVFHDMERIAGATRNGTGNYGVINGKVYELSPYFRYLADPFSGQGLKADEKLFLPVELTNRFNDTSIKKGETVDFTETFNRVAGTSGNYRNELLLCLDNIFYVGTVDISKSPRCLVTNYILIASSGIVILVTLIKFFAALQFGGKRVPMEYDKFVIMQVPCYTEGDDSIKKTLESLALTDYDDKHKLLFVISDGMLIGSGNDKPTPRIVCDVLGVDPEHDPEPFAFQSVAEGSKQLNYGKVFSGLYECEGRQVPYIVVAKVGSPSEKSRPGNRGKRDSQIVLMNFLNRVHFDSPMAPLELEIYHQMKNVIGVDPKLYEFILMVDADTEVMEDSMTRLISVMIRDSAIMGLCGETKLSNENDSMTTMIQVYEYYISHHLAKAFESLFGSVTCLPGCFSMYRIRTVSGKPLIINNGIISDYSVNRVDTLHTKNLLHLGEDRYLTTLMLKHFPQYKLKFTPDAQCKTVAPDQFEVLMSQRRRWINSTIHNLFELVFLEQMCGFCCFSMRFVVFLDLVGTIILPSTVIYLVYIIIAASVKFQTFDNYAIVMMVASYVLQALIFLLKLQWQHIGWMIFYIFGIPFFSFYLPIYSYWHFDDFSWGNTRVVVGDGVQKVITEDEEEFDPDSIPMMKWSDYEQKLWETGSQGSGSSNQPLAMAPQVGYGHSNGDFIGGLNPNLYGRASPTPSQGLLSRVASPSPYQNQQPGSNNSLNRMTQMSYQVPPNQQYGGGGYLHPMSQDPRASQFNNAYSTQGYNQKQ